MLTAYDERSVVEDEVSNANNFVCVPVIAELGLPFVFDVCVAPRVELGVLNALV